MQITIGKTAGNFTREPFLKPFGFKGRYLSEAWQAVAGLQSSSGKTAVGLATQSVLWCDSAVFEKYSYSGGNSVMFLMTEYALKRAAGMKYSTPFELLDALVPDVFEYGKKITGHAALRLTFALNALVAVDNAAWMLYAMERGTESFDELVPREYRSALDRKQDRLGVIPLMSYGVSLEEIVAAVMEGYFLLKIKIGSDPKGDGDPEKMLAWDMDRIKAIHERVRDIACPYTDNGKTPYYFDANGRYDSKDRLRRFLDFTKKIGAFDRIVIVEEPFDEHADIEVGDLGVRVAADESAHSVKDAETRIQMGYGAIALKPIAKTMSESIRIAAMARAKNIPCFCADLTVNPILLEWNKTVAARLPVLPGLKIGVVESNGHQNYTNWDAMTRQHPAFPADYLVKKRGLFHLGGEFYRTSGGIFRVPEDYLKLLNF